LSIRTISGHFAALLCSDYAIDRWTETWLSLAANTSRLFSQPIKFLHLTNGACLLS